MSRPLTVYLLLFIAAACHSDVHGPGQTALVAAFNTRTEVASLAIEWVDSDRFQLRARNHLRDPLYVRLERVRIRHRNGTGSVTVATPVECVLPGSASAIVFTGGLWRRAFEHFEADHFALPLSVRGKGIYREYLLQRGVRPDAADAEIARYASAPECGSL